MKFLFVLGIMSLIQASAFAVDTDKTYYLNVKPEGARELFKQGTLRGIKEVVTASGARARYQVADVVLNGSLVRCWNVMDDGQSFLAQMPPEGKFLCFIPSQKDLGEFPAKRASSAACVESTPEEKTEIPAQ
jgi:hypothetical protein